jgi:hypothetical protein
MEFETDFLTPLHEGATRSTQPLNRREIVQEILSQQSQTTRKTKPVETRMDILSAAMIFGLSALFVSAIFGVVTDYIPRILDLIGISVFIGLFVSVITYALMKEDE